MKKIAFYLIFLGLAYLPCFVNPDFPIYYAFFVTAWGFGFGMAYDRVIGGREELKNQKDVLLGFIRVFWEGDPILATAVWKKAYPNVTPPWHQQ